MDNSDRSEGMLAASASITPNLMPMSLLPRSDWLGSITSPPLMTRSNLSFGPMAALAPETKRALAAKAPNAPVLVRNSRREVAPMKTPPLNASQPNVDDGGTAIAPRRRLWRVLRWSRCKEQYSRLGGGKAPISAQGKSRRLAALHQ